MEIEIWHIWLLAAVLLFIIEIFMTSFVAVCIGTGALVTGIGAYWGLDITQQLVLFSVFTFLSLFFIRPFAQKFILRSKTDVNTNADALIGKKARVVETINHKKRSGRVEIDGDNWKATSFDGQEIHQGQIVTIVSYESIVLTVK